MPIRPVANWSRLVLPIRIAPGRLKPLDDRRRAFRHVSEGRAARVVGSPATSMLSLTANGMPNSGRAVAAACAHPSAVPSSTSEIQIGLHAFFG